MPLRGRTRGWPATAWVLGLASIIWISGGWHAEAAARASRPAGPRSWTVYHGDAAGTGVAGRVRAVDTTAPAWTSPVLDGQIYGEPLVFGGRVYVATERDTVYALSAATGAVAWSAHLGHPVPASSLPCGDIAPTVGITGTPVIDRARHEIFVVADELAQHTPAHLLVGLSTASGRREMTTDVDPSGADTAALLQRTGLTLDAGQVVFGFGGNFGDCAAYRGTLVAVPEKGGTPKDFTVDAAPGESQGAIWMGGAAPAVDRRGHIWVSVGNGSVRSRGHTYDDSDSVLELSPSLRLLQFFAPSNWAANNSQDLDMSTEPALLPDGQVIVAGKSRIVYLLNGTRLGGIGGAQAALGGVCGKELFGGTAVVGRTVYLPCFSGVIAVRATKSPARISLTWSTQTGGGPPIVAAGLVWTIGRNGTLYGLDPATGRIRQQAAVGVLANHFPTPSLADGLLLAASARRVVAFRATAHGSPASLAPTVTPSTPSAASTTPASQPGSPPAASHGGSLPAAALGGMIAGGAVLIGGIGWLLWRRRSSRAG